MNTPATNEHTGTGSTHSTHGFKPSTKRRLPVKGFVKFLGVCAIGFTLGIVSAKPWSTLATVRERLTQSVAGKIPIDAVRTTPAPGLFEVQSGSDIFYTDATGKFVVLDGRLMDLDKQIDLTKVAIDKASSINFGTDLPLQLAIKEVKGNGKRVMAVFEDPACPSCRVLNKLLSQMEDVTIYHFMYPIIDSEGGAYKVKATLCAPEQNRLAIWNTFMDGGMVQGDMSCDASAVGTIMTAGRKLGIHNTPTVFLQNGQRLVGALPPDQFVAALDAAAPR